jgi:Zn-dependent M28 family amino/carboxypeptidase
MRKLEENNLELEFYPPPDKRQRPPIPVVASTATRRSRIGVMPDKYIAEMIRLVSDENIKRWVCDLCAFPTRHSKSAYIDRVSEWVADRFREVGYADVIMHEYARQGYQLKNVVCTKQGSENTGRSIILCGHYDSIGTGEMAPGADDDATGVAVLIELARIIAKATVEDTIQFVVFSGEEQGLWGSTAYAQYVKENNINLYRLINLDMLGYPDENRSILIERDMGNAVPDNDQPSSEFAELMAQMAADFTDLPVKFGPIFSSDYMPFEARGYVAVGAFEGGENPNYHTSNDAPDTLDYKYVAEIARVVLATLLYESAQTNDKSKCR